MDQKYVKFLLDSKRSIIEFETIELSHPAFTQSYFIVRNHPSGLTLGVESLDGSFQQVEFQYVPMTVTPTAFRNDLDFGLEISFGDLGEILQVEANRVLASPENRVKPNLIYRGYRSDDLSAPMNGPFELTINDITFNRDGATFIADARRLNLTRIGEVYTTQRFKGLRGL